MYSNPDSPWYFSLKTILAKYIIIIHYCNFFKNAPRKIYVWQLKFYKREDKITQTFQERARILRGKGIWVLSPGTKNTKFISVNSDFLASIGITSAQEFVKIDLLRVT